MRTRLGHYDIVAELGRGGMGVVYKGYEASLNRYVAIKVLADSLAHDEGIKERFLREARSMAALNDPHIIQIYFIGDDEGQTYFVMEFVEGESLGSMLKREHKLTVEQSAKIIQQTALGLATAHDRGVVHRDIKPGNLMITARGGVKIADFGIALSNHDLSSKLTTTGEFVGTPGYLSPEVCLGKPVDQRSDIFSLGIVLFEMLTGKMPFSDESPLGLMLEVVRAEIPDVRQLNADADAQIAGILARMIAKDPADRYQNCHDLVDELSLHPLVAKGGPITAQTKMSPAAATMIGQKTPASGQVSLPKTPSSAAAGAAAAANTRITPSGLPPPPVVAASAHQSVLDRTTTIATQPRRSPLPWAIAALVLLGVGGAAYAYRERIPGLNGLIGTPTSASTNAPATATPNGAVSSTPSAADSIKASMASSASSASVPPPPPPPAAPDTLAPSTPAKVVVDAAGNVAVHGSDGVSVSVSADGSSSVRSADGSRVVSDGAGNTSVTAAADPAAPAARASQAGMQALHDLPAAQAAVDAAQAMAAQTVAKIAPPEKPVAPPKPRVPTIAVVAAGDDVISSPAEEAVVSLLQGRGFRVIEGGRTHGDRPNLGALAGRADAVVFVNARPVGTQQINYYGQSSTLYTVQLGMKAYKIDGSVIWTGGSEQVNFTTLNAAEKAREAIEPMLDQVDGRLAEFRSRGKRG